VPTPTRFLACTAALILAGTVVALQLNSQPPVAKRAYVGQETCMTSGCHADAYADGSDYKGAEAFRQTMHQRIHLRPTPETVVIDRLFDKDTTIRKALPQVQALGKDTLLIRLFKSPDRKDYMIQMRFSGGGDSTAPMKVAYTYGGNGWIQRYLVEINGIYHVAPFQYILPSYKNRSAYGGKFYYLDFDKWFTIEPVSSTAQFLLWNSNAFRATSWDKNCAQCHVNGFDISVQVNGGDTAWHARWAGSLSGDSAFSDQNLKIGCESCHGPGSEHAANPTADNIVSPSSITQFPETPEGTDRKLDVCNQCHMRFKSTGKSFAYAYDEANGLPFIPGLSLKDFFSDQFHDMNVWADGVTSYAHHQTGQDFIRSKPYAAHIFRNACWSCHQVHSVNADGLPYQLDRNWYSLTKGKGCVAYGCHPGMTDTGFDAGLGRMVNLHTMHSQSSSQCVNCHFTKTATIAFDDLPEKPLYEFSNHGFTVLRPVSTIFYSDRSITGMMNTCAESCHRNGRGSRNRNDSMPAAPAFGTVDRLYENWKEQSDIDLADSLWMHYQQLYAKYLSADRESAEAAGGTAITEIAPNPARGEAQVRFTLARAGNISLMVFDLTGRMVRTIVAGHHEAGTWSRQWDGTDETGNALPSGTYVVRLTTPQATRSMKLVVER
jgi:hypothetical protein